MRTIRFSLLLTLAMLAIVAGASQGAESGQRLFHPVVAPNESQTVTDDGVIRRRYVQVDSALLAGPDGAGAAEGQTLQIDLFDGESYLAVADEIESPADGQVIWQGHLQDRPTDVATIVTRDGVAAGSIWVGNRFYRLTYHGNGIHVLDELPGVEPKSEHPPIAVEPEAGQVNSQNGGQSTTADNGSIVDVMVVYTPASRNRYGGTAGIEALIDLAVAETNQAYERSQINTRLALVATAEVSYNESGSMVDDLYRLQRTGDGYMEAVHNWRDSYAADMVSLIQEASDYCGIAFLMTSLSSSFESHAFSVIDSDCATGYYSFGHELGHNMGSTHDRANGDNALFDYSYGYWAADYSFRTIMAYNCPGGCTRVQNFSNPNVNYPSGPSGLPTGIAYGSNPSQAADNARSINEASFTVANWRDSSTRKPAAPTALTAVANSPTQIELSWQDRASNETGYALQRRIAGQSWAQIADLPANSTGYVDDGRSADTSYEYRVRAYDNSQVSDFSNVASVTTPRLPELHVGGIAGLSAVESGSSAEGFDWRAMVTVQVHDAYHDPVGGATVNGTWGGEISGGATCVTDGSGRCSVSRTGLGPAIDVVTFAVTDITYNGDPYEPGNNHDPNGNNSSVTVRRPTSAIYLTIISR